MLTVKLIHVACAYLTGAGFLLRGVLAIVNHPLLQHRLLKTLPHVVDTLLLACALIMLYQWSIPLSGNPWLWAKILALFIYIGFGLLMLRWGKTRTTRLLGLFGGLLTYSYIVVVAHNKSPFFLFG